MTRILLFACLMLTAALAQSAGIAPSAETVTPVLVGARVPDVAVRALDGETTSLADVVSGKPTVLVFYRGGWCPFCNLQLSQLNGIDKELVALGYQVVAISPDAPEKIKETLDKEKLGYSIYSDSGLAAIKAFGIGFRVPDETVEKYRGYGISLAQAPGEADSVLPVPSVFVIDAAGVIQFVYVNPDYRIRMSSELLLTAARTSLAVKPLEPRK